MLTMRLLPIAFAALLAGGCTLGPNYTRPVVELPDAHRGATPGSQPGAASLADLAWFELFRDDTLTALVTSALQENFELRIAAERVLQARLIPLRLGAQQVAGLLEALGHVRREGAALGAHVGGLGRSRARTAACSSSASARGSTSRSTIARGSTG